MREGSWPDGIGGRLVEVMLQVMNSVLWSESCPADWKRSLLVPLHKNGANEKVGNYRGLALGCNVAKVFMRVMARVWEGLLRIGF